MSQKKAKGRGTMSRRMARLEAERRRAVLRRRLIRTAQVGVPLLVFGIGLVIFLQARGGGTAESTSAVTDITKSPASTRRGGTTTVTSGEQRSGETEGKPQFATPPVQMIDAAKSYTATIETTKGNIVAQLSPTIAPATVNSFVFLARCGFYDATLIHRVAKDFVIQGGDPTGSGTGGPGYTVRDELPAQPGYPVGSLAMANSGPGTSGSQFFIVTGPKAADLPNNYSLFGHVVAGQDVARAIEQLPSNPAQDGKPLEAVAIVKVTIDET